MGETLAIRLAIGMAVAGVFGLFNSNGGWGALLGTGLVNFFIALAFHV